MQGNKVQRPLSGGRAAVQTASGAGVWWGLTAGSEQGAKSRRNPRGPGQLTAKSHRSRGQRRQESSAQAPRGKLNLSRQRPGPGSRPPPPLSAGPGPPHPPAPGAPAPAPRRSAPHGRCPAPAPRRPPPQDAGSPAAGSRRLPLEGGAGGAGRSGAEPGRAPPEPSQSPLRAPGVTWRRGSTAKRLRRSRARREGPASDRKSGF